MAANQKFSEECERLEHQLEEERVFNAPYREPPIGPLPRHDYVPYEAEPNRCGKCGGGPKHEIHFSKADSINRELQLQWAAKVSQLESSIRDAEYAAGEGFDCLPRVQALKAQVAMLGENYQGFLAMSAEMNRLGRFFREHYAYEIESGQHARFPSAIDAAIFYMSKKRRRGGFWRWIRGWGKAGAGRGGAGPEDTGRAS